MDLQETGHCEIKLEDELLWSNSAKLLFRKLQFSRHYNWEDFNINITYRTFGPMIGEYYIHQFNISMR